MSEDPILDEIHRIREELLEEHGGIEGYFEYLQREQEKYKERLVTLPPRRPWSGVRPSVKTVIEDFGSLSDEEQKEVLAELLRAADK